jgi:hypothetical protein
MAYLRLCNNLSVEDKSEKEDYIKVTKLVISCEEFESIGSNFWTMSHIPIGQVIIIQQHCSNVHVKKYLL